MGKQKYKRLILLTAGLLLILLIGGCGFLAPAEQETSVTEPLPAQQQAHEEPETPEEPQEVEIAEAVEENDSSVFGERYYYRNLNEEEQELYAYLYHRIDDLAEEISFTKEIDPVVFHKSYYALTQDCPEFFWLGSNLKVITMERSGNVTAVGISFDDVGREEVQQQREVIEEITSQWIAEIDPAADTYEKIKRVFEIIVEQTDYVEGALYNQDIRSVFLNRESVCAGYARAMEYLLTKMDVFSTIVNGELIDGTAHCWNLVQIDEEYYWVDVTQGDASSDGSAIYYAYLCFDDETLNRNYVIDKTVGLSTMPDQVSEYFQYPACGNTQYSYYLRQGLAYDSFAAAEIQDYVYQKATEGERFFAFQFTREDVYNEAVRAMEDQSLLESVLQNLMQEQGISNWKYRYSCDSRVYVIYIML